MRIVLTAPVEESVPPSTYGGTELIVYNLCQEMVNRGHEVFLLASGDSRTNAHLIPLVPLSLRKAYAPEKIDSVRNFLKIHQIATVLQEIRRLQPDIVYNHQGWRFAPFISLVDCPVFTTIHGPLTSENEIMTFNQYPQTLLISISNNQRKAMPHLNWVDTIYNGIDLSLFELGEKSTPEYFAFLGRTSPEKGLKEICQMIRQTSHRLKIAAKIDTVDRAYFEQEVKPLIDGQQIQFMGEVGGERKKKFLQQAKGLLLWLNWEEPFGLVVTEAMASGTPVIVNKRGSMPELIRHTKTGFLVKTITEMSKYLDQVSMINPTICRQHVEKHFSIQIMTQHYLELAGRKL